ncbi:nucleic acid-binding, OB-fold, replication protein A, OB domain protein [Tanacetum coccineum]
MSLIVTKTNMIKELTSLQDDWCIKVRIIRLRKLMAFKDPLENWKIEMVLQDEEENKIVATMKESICPKFEKCLEEGKCFYISTFSVEDSQGTPKIIENKNKIHFYKATDVTPCDTYSGSVHGFRLIENRIHEGDDHCVTHLTMFSSYSIKNDFLNNLPKVAMSCVVVAIVKKIESEYDWWYLAYVKLMDSTGSVSLTLFDRHAYSIIDKSAAKLLQEVRKGDIHILPTDFNKLLENTYAFKVDIKDFNIEKDKHMYGISQLTNDTNIINELIKRESDDQEIQSVDPFRTYLT